MYCSEALNSQYTLPVHVLSCLVYCASFNPQDMGSSST